MSLVSSVFLRPTIVGGLLAALLAVSGLASAQYVWLDDQGVKQFSDMPPPSSVPANHILKAPSFGKNLPQGPDDANDTKNSPTLAEQEMDFNKRMQARRDSQAKTQSAAKDAEDKRRACEQARATQRTLNSGRRIEEVDSSGQRKSMSDQEKAAAARTASETLNKCK